MSPWLDVGAYVLYHGVLMKIVGLADGLSVIMTPVAQADFPRCEHCGAVQPPPQVHLRWDSALFQDGVTGVPTVQWSQP